MVRSFVTISGFLVFLISAKMFGPEGRGIIAYGTSVIAFVGISLSLNFGRSFLLLTEKNEDLKKELLFPFLLLTLVSFVLTATAGLIFFSFVSSAKEIVPIELAWTFLPLSIFYVWSVNGNAFFASFQRTFQQEIVIFTIRTILMVVVIFFMFQKEDDLSDFIYWYSLVLATGTIVEISILSKDVFPYIRYSNFTSFFSILRSSLIPHIDFLSFNLFPLCLMIIAGWGLDKSSIGRVNFAIQAINVVFLLSTTAGIRVSSYVSNSGFKVKLAQIKKLFIGTTIMSIIAIICAYSMLELLTSKHLLVSFSGVSELFLFISLSVPGYMLYQFLTPIWIEMKLIKKSAYLNFAIFILAIIASLSLMPYFSEKSITILFSGFHLLLFIGQLFLVKKYI